MPVNSAVKSLFVAHFTLSALSADLVQAPERALARARFFYVTRLFFCLDQLLESDEHESKVRGDTRPGSKNEGGKGGRRVKADQTQTFTSFLVPLRNVVLEKGAFYVRKRIAIIFVVDVF